MSAPVPRSGFIEIRSIDYVPVRERHGSVADQAKFWFLGNFHFFTIAIGFIGPSMGLSLGWTILAGALGILIGTVFQAFHASQGAEMGLPQMIQSRAQFGYRGVILPLLVTLFNYVAFDVLDVIFIASGLFSQAGWNKAAVSIAVSLIGGALAIWGHDWLHRAFKILFWINVPALTVLSLAMLAGLHGGPLHAAPGGFNAVAFLAQLTAGASYNITYATYVSDYSRYLPPATRRGHIIASVFAGASLSAIWLIAVGAWLAIRLGGTDALLALTQAGNLVFPSFGYALACASVAALVATMGMNFYSGMLTVITVLDAIRPVRPTRRLRVVNIVVLMAVGAALAIGFGGDAIGALNNAFVVMLYLLVPWTAINLTDYFFVRRGRYAITQLFVADGIYGNWGRAGLVSYGLGFALSLPFCVLPDIFTGPAAAALGGVDIGWVVGLAATAAIYWRLTRSLDLRHEDQAIDDSARALAALG